MSINGARVAPASEHLSFGFLSQNEQRLESVHHDLFGRIDDIEQLTFVTGEKDCLTVRNCKRIEIDLVGALSSKLGGH